MKVTNVEVREINPPPAILDAMARQMSAERTRRAVVTEAEGTKQAAITVAEGDKQSTILAAEGDRQAAIVQAEGFALALKQIYGVAHGVDANTMTLQYFEALKRLGDSPATKFVVPMELAGLLRGVAGSVDQSFTNGHGDLDPPPNADDNGRRRRARNRRPELASLAATLPSH